MKWQVFLTTAQLRLIKSYMRTAEVLRHDGNVHHWWWIRLAKDAR